jgi:uncharacterized repeat protein (TIGR03803 family)
VIHRFDGGSAGWSPAAGLIQDKVGNLYGTTFSGKRNRGAVFELSPSKAGWKEKTLHSFSGGADGSMPTAALTLDQAGNLYGTTSLGGVYGGGTVFELTSSRKGKWKETVLHSFGSGSDGALPAASVVFDKAGNLYGTTQDGGIGYGTVFRLTHSKKGWKETVLCAFDGADGYNAFSGLTWDRAGDLYGTTVAGGSQICQLGCGTVYKLTPTGKSWTEKVVHEFTAGPGDGAQVYAGVILDAKGNLYGTTELGGTAGGGIVYEITP